MAEEVFSPEMSKLFKDKLGATREDDETISLYIWDFAGHEMYYTTHQVHFQWIDKNSWYMKYIKNICIHIISFMKH